MEIWCPWQWCDHNAVINCIPGPHYKDNSGDLVGTYPGIYRILCPRRLGTYPGLICGEIFWSKGLEIYYPGMSTYARTLLCGGDLPRDLQEKCAPQSQAVPWTSQSTKFNPWASPRYPRVVGVWVTIDSSITILLFCFAAPMFPCWIIEEHDIFQFRV